MSDFDILHRRYLEDKATPEERERLFAMIRSGKYDQLINDELKAELAKDDNSRLPAEEEEILGRIPGEFRNPVPGAGRGRVVPLYRRRWLAVAASVSFVIASVVFITVQRNEQPVAQQEETSEPGFFTGRQLVHLPDGSTALLNDGSTLKYEESFGEQSREVILTGESYFNVQPDASRPFVVHTGKIRTTVLGTAFNVKATGPEVIVTVSHGKVAVGDSEKVYSNLLPDEQLAVNTITHKFEKTSTNVDKALEWKSQFLVLDRVTMQEAASIIGDHYNAKVIVTSEELKKCEVRVAFLHGESLEQVIEMLTLPGGASYSVEDGTVTIEGGRCNN